MTASPGPRVGPDLPGWVDVETDPVMLGPEADRVWCQRCVGATAAAFDGWNWRDQKDAFAVLLYPNDRLAWARLGAQQQSHCALWGASVLRYAGADDAELWRPYERRNDAVTLLQALALRHGAWRTPEGGAEPDPASLVLIGRQLPGGLPDPAYVRGTRATEHVSLMVGFGRTAQGASLVHGIDGGQAHPQNGSPAIRSSTRRVERVGGELWWAHTAHGNGDDGRPLVGRRIVGWLDVPSVPRPRPALVPEAFARA